MQQRDLICEKPIWSNPIPVPNSYCFFFPLFKTFWFHSLILSLTFHRGNAPYFLFNILLQISLKQSKFKKKKSTWKAFEVSKIKTNVKCLCLNVFWSLCCLKGKNKSHRDMQCRAFSEDCFPQTLTAATVEIGNYFYPFHRCVILLCFCCTPLLETAPDSLQTLLVSITGKLHPWLQKVFLLMGNLDKFHLQCIASHF